MGYVGEYFHGGNFHGGREFIIWYNTQWKNKYEKFFFWK